MVREFPHFTPLHIDHKEIFAHHLHTQEAYSDYNFASIWSWDVDKAVRIATLYGNLVVQFSDYTTNTPFLSFIGTNQVAQTAGALLAYCEGTGLTPELRLLPESVISLLGDSKRTPYIITETRDDHDYILSTEAVAALGHRTFHEKRTQYNTFVRLHGDKTESRQLNLTSPTTLTAMWRVFDRWQHGRGKSGKDVANERHAIERCLQAAPKLGVQGLGMYVDNELASYILFDTLHPTTANAHFEKAVLDYKGIFEFGKRTLAQHLINHRIEFLNIEQDLGIPGLRQAKLAYKPVKFLKKFSLSSAA